VQLLVSRPVGVFRFLRHVRLRGAELSAGREEEVDAVIAAPRVRSREDAGEAEVTHTHTHTHTHTVKLCFFPGSKLEVIWRSYGGHMLKPLKQNDLL